MKTYSVPDIGDRIVWHGLHGIVLKINLDAFAEYMIVKYDNGVTGAVLISGIWEPETKS